MENLLGAGGLTSSEANHVTNIVKELVKGLNTSMPLTTTKATVGDKTYPLDNNKRLDGWVNVVEQKGRLYSLSAWLKTGIKGKENELKRLDDLTRAINMESVGALGQIEGILPLIPRPKTPSTTFEAYMNSLTTKERAEYLSNEAMAAHIGQFVHKFDDIRERLEGFEATTLKELKNEIVVEEHELLYEEEELLQGFFQLQREHRDYEKSVNYWKAQHKTWERVVLDEHQKELIEVEGKNREIQIHNANLKTEATEKMLAEVRSDKALISKLKIIIPKDLQSTLDYVQEYAKNPIQGK